MEQLKEVSIEEVKETLDEMGIPYKEEPSPDNQMELIKSFGYESLSLTVDLKAVSNVDAETGVVVRTAKHDIDNGVYIFTVLHSGQAGFIVVVPSTISRAPVVHQVTSELSVAISGIDMPPLMPYDMVQIVAHTLSNTFMRMIMESCQIPKDYEELFLRVYMPRFLSNVGLYFVGATKEDGTPMVYEEIANMEPMMVWRSIQKGADGNEGESAGDTGAADAGDAGTAADAGAGNTDAAETEDQAGAEG